jgi:hypothetical protein
LKTFRVGNIPSFITAIEFLKEFSINEFFRAFSRPVFYPNATESPKSL